MAKDKRDPEDIFLENDPEKMRPLGNQVVIKLDPLPEKLGSGLLYATGENRSEEHRTGTVIAVGPGKVATKTGIRCPMDLKSGDRVLLGRYVGADFKYGGETYRVMPEEQVYCAVE
jgi:chaperonin GroES